MALPPPQGLSLQDQSGLPSPGSRAGPVALVLIPASQVCSQVRKCHSKVLILAQKPQGEITDASCLQGPLKDDVGPHLGVQWPMSSQHTLCSQRARGQGCFRHAAAAPRLAGYNQAQALFSVNAHSLTRARGHMPGSSPGRGFAVAPTPCLRAALSPRVPGRPGMCASLFPRSCRGLEHWSSF